MNATCHADFGRSKSKRVGISGKVTKSGSAGASLIPGFRFPLESYNGAWDLKTIMMALPGERKVWHLSSRLRQSIDQNFYIGLSGNRHCKDHEGHNRESPGNEKQNRCSLRCCLNAANDEAEVTCSGSVFQVRAPATGKAREPTEVRRTCMSVMNGQTDDTGLRLVPRDKIAYDRL